MKILHIAIADKRATFTKRDGVIICGNSDYKVAFTFDDEWEGITEKTARFIWDGQYYDEPFTGTECDVPIIMDADKVEVGVYAGELRTTTGAEIPCQRSILSGGTTMRPEQSAEYRDQAVEAAERAEAAAQTAAADAAVAAAEELERRVSGAIVQEMGDSATAVMSQKTTTKYLTAIPEQIKETINAKTSVNMFDQTSDKIRRNCFINWQGYTDNENEAAGISHPIYLEAGKTYKAKHNPFVGNAVDCARTDIHGDFIERVKGTMEGTYSDGFDVFTPQISGWYTFNVHPGRNYMICEYDKYPDQFAPYGLTINAAVSAEGVQGKLDIANAGHLIPSVNMYNSASEKNRKNCYIGPYGYIDRVQGYSQISHPIYLEAGKTYKANHNYEQGANVYFGHTDVNGNLIEVVWGSLEGEMRGGYDVLSVQTSGWYTFNASLGNPVMFCEYDQFPNAFVDYGHTPANSIGLNEKQLALVRAVATQSPLFGKKIALNGDSICFGSGYPGGYGRIIANRFNMIYQNIAVAGGTIAAETQDGDGNALHWISRTIANMDADADYIVLEGGVNDAYKAIEKGSISVGYTATLDDTTFCGAFESMLKQALVRFHGKKIGYIAIHKAMDGFDSQGDESNLYHLAKRCCAKWGVPFCDLNNNVPPFGYLVGDGATAIRETYTKSGDGLHPNQAGYEKYYVPQIIAFLESL